MHLSAFTADNKTLAVLIANMGFVLQVSGILIIIPTELS